MNEEGLEKTNNDKIFIGEPMDITIESVENKLEKLKQAINKENIQYTEIKEVIKQVVPTFKEPEDINLKEKGLE